MTAMQRHLESSYSEIKRIFFLSCMQVEDVVCGGEDIIFTADNPMVYPMAIEIVR